MSDQIPPVPKVFTLADLDHRERVMREVYRLSCDGPPLKAIVHMRQVIESAQHTLDSRVQYAAEDGVPHEEIAGALGVTVQASTGPVGRC